MLITRENIYSRGELMFKMKINKSKIIAYRFD